MNGETIRVSWPQRYAYESPGSNSEFEPSKRFEGTIVGFTPGAYGPTAIIAFGKKLVNVHIDDLTIILPAEVAVPGVL